MNRKESRHTRDVEVYGIAPEPFRPGAEIVPEEPGPFAFPPMAACITAAARLMLATLEALVTRASGTWAFADTESMAVVATRTGQSLDYTDHTGLTRTFPALTWAQVDEIVKRFEALNPYDRDIVPGSILEIEHENYEIDPADPERRRVLKNKRRQLYCHAISAKRYPLYNLDQAGRPVLRSIAGERDPRDEDETHHPLGDLRKHSEHWPRTPPQPHRSRDDSRDWIAHSWKRIIRADPLGLPASEPDWIAHPALTRATITTPGLLKPFDEQNRKRPLAERIRPYNFLLVAHVARLGHPPGADPERFLSSRPMSPTRTNGASSAGPTPTSPASATRSSPSKKQRNAQRTGTRPQRSRER